MSIHPDELFTLGDVGPDSQSLGMYQIHFWKPILIDGKFIYISGTSTSKASMPMSPSMHPEEIIASSDDNPLYSLALPTWTGLVEGWYAEFVLPIDCELT